MGLEKHTSPHARGFERSFTFLPGCGNHYNYEPQVEQGQPKPHFIKSDGWWLEDDKNIDRQKDLPEDFYSTKTFTDRLLNIFETRTEEQKEEPFFAFLPFTAPHYPLQAPRETIEKYKGVYDEGPDKLREKRLKRLIELGLIAKDVEPAPVVGALGHDKEWAEKSAEEKAASARKMEVNTILVDFFDGY